MSVEISGAIREFKSLLGSSPIEPQKVADLLNGMGHEARVAATRSLGKAEQRRLYEGVDGFRPIRLVDIVPPSAQDFRPVRHFGKNTLPAFTHFEKHFCRPKGVASNAPGKLYGYNFQPTSWLASITGPGYFIAHEDPGRTEVWVDYNQVPTEHPDQWPEIQSNEKGLGRFVYGFMIDTLRGVSEHVSIGSAARRGRDLGSWFVLCREP